MINGKATPFIVRTILFIILMFCVFTPITASIWILSSGKGPHLGLVFSFILFWGIGIYLLRVILWNTYGQELLTLKKEKIAYVADYNYFKDGKRQIGVENLMTKIIYEGGQDNTLGRLYIYNKKEVLETVLQTNISDLIQIENDIKSRYNL